MKMDKRKQKLEVKPEDLFSAEKDSLMDYDVTNTDWFSSSSTSDLDIHSNAMYYDDDILNLFDIPFSFDDEPLLQENKEIFQDLACTSTPKSSPPTVSKIFNDSGIEESVVNKTDASYKVLDDITDKVYSIKNSNYTNLSQLSESRLSGISSDSSSRKHVNIVRKHFVIQKRNKNNSVSNCITKEQLIYYSGIKNYSDAIAILKHIKMPKNGVSSFKMQLMALMKLRLDLPWLDMSFRFSIPESKLKEIVKKAFDIMSYSLEHLIPWHSQTKTSKRTVSRTYYVYSLISGETSHILIALTDSKRPVLFVSENYSSKTCAISAILNKCSTHLIPGDVLCVTDETGIDQFYTVNSQDTEFYLSSPSPNQYSVVEKCHFLMTELLSEFTFLAKQNDNTFDIRKLAIVASAIININAVSAVNAFQLNKIFEKSSQIVLQ